MTVRVEVRGDQAGLRLDELVAWAGEMSRTRAADLVSSGAVLVDGRRERKSYRVCEGDVVEIPDAEAPRYAPPAGVSVVWEDEHLLVVDKPAGVVVHAAAGVREGTLVDALAARGTALARAPDPDRPGIVHRLDRDVSGLLVVAKTDDVHASLSQALRRREIERRYAALVHGTPSADRGKIDAPVGRDPKHRTRMTVAPGGRASVTWFAVVERFSEASLLDVRLETGRTHQIRTHLASIGHAVVGDAAYGRDPSLARRLGLRRPFLHACRLAFVHPVTRKRVEVTSELPAELSSALGELRS